MSAHSVLARLEGVTVYYQETSVLEDINLVIRFGEILGIIGPNGAGKTTLLKVLLGLKEPSKGQVEILGLPPKEGRRYLGYVPQSFSFERDFPITVWEVVLMGRLGLSRPPRRYHDTDHELALEALEEVEMAHLKNRPIGHLSGGQMQRVLVARALARRPQLLLLDEPTASIDTPTQASFYELLNQLKKRMGIVLVTHDIGAVSTYVDKVACLNRHLYFHNSHELSLEDLESAYNCPVELLAHGVAHRVLAKHEDA